MPFQKILGWNKIQTRFSVSILFDNNRHATFHIQQIEIPLC